MSRLSYYQEYAEMAIEDLAERDAKNRYVLVDALKHLDIKRVLDIGCGAGQELLPFVESKNTYGVGIDIGEELGKVAPKLARQTNSSDKLGFCRSQGEELPFKDESFDVVLCRVALPYMDNKKAIAEIARVLSPNGAFLLKTHALPFYFGMLRERAKTLSPKQLAYPIICLVAGAWHSFTGTQLKNGIWSGKEIFQTKNFLTKELAKHGMIIESKLPDTNRKTPSFLILKK